MFLARHVIEYPDVYRRVSQTIRERHPKSVIILDNMYFEDHISWTFAQLDPAVTICQPDLLVLPDIDGDDIASLAADAKAFLGLHPDLRFIYVPHSENIDDYVDECYRALKRIPGVTAIGVIEEMHRLVGISRQTVIEKYLIDLPCAIHLLGMTEDLSDLRSPVVRARCAGCDSGKLVAWSREDLLVTAEHVPPYPGRGDSLEMLYMPEHLELTLRRNVRYWNNYVRSPIPSQLPAIPPAPVTPPIHPLILREVLIAMELLSMKGQQYNPEEDPFKVISFTSKLGLPAYVGALARLADKWHRLENQFINIWAAGEPLQLTEDLARELFIDLGNYAMLCSALYIKEKEASRCAVSTE